MLVNLEPYPESTGTAIMLEVEPENTIKDLISLYRFEKHMATSRSLVIFDEDGNTLSKRKTLLQLKIPNGHTLRIGFQDEVFPTGKRWGMMFCIGGVVAIIIITIIAVVLFFVFKDKIEKDAKHRSIVEESILFQPNRNVWCKDPPDSARKYGIVMEDVGPVTCLLSYSWGVREKGTACVSDDSNCCFKNIKGGQAYEEAEEHSKQLKMCLKRLTTGIGARNVSFYFAITAKTRIQIMKKPKKVLHALNWTLSQARQRGFASTQLVAVPGDDEALYGWIAANYLREVFGENVSPYGFMDLGTVSTEIAFTTAPGEETKKIQLYGREYNIFAASSLCFGNDMARERYLSRLIKNITETNLTDPCLPLNYTLTRKGHQILLDVCSMNSRFTRDMADKKGTMNIRYTFVGTANPMSCRRGISRMFEAEDCYRNAYMECLEKITVPEDTKFLAHSSFFSAIKFLNLKKLSLREYLDKAESFCRHGFIAIEQLAYIPDHDRAKLCFNLLYVYELLVTGYGFTDSTWNNLRFVGGQTEEEDISWTLGFMINKTNSDG